MPQAEFAAFMAVTGALLIAFVLLLRFLRAWMLHKSLRRAIDRNSADAPALIATIEAMDRGRSALGNDDRNGMVLIALAVAAAGYGWIAVDDPGMMRALMGGALFPLLIGGVLLARHQMLKREIERGVDGDA